MDAGPSTLAASLDGGRNPLRNKRTRRATIGNEIDQIILHEMKSQVDNGPSIPLETKFIFTTNRDILPAHEQISGAFDLKNDSHKGYFDRPEVIDSYRKQLLIETPEFERIGPNQTVTSRFQPHMADANGIVDTTDAAYEKRHRRYERMEKGGRLRDVEKLQNKQYHLHERIEQLRAFDSNSFLSIDASYFHGRPSASEDQSLEGDRRRRQMLQAALDLEARLKEALPNPRKKKSGTVPYASPSKRAKSAVRSRPPSPPQFYYAPQQADGESDVSDAPPEAVEPPIPADTAKEEVYYYQDYESSVQHPLDIPPDLDDDDDPYIEPSSAKKRAISKSKGKSREDSSDDGSYVEDAPQPVKKKTKPTPRPIPTSQSSGLKIKLPARTLPSATPTPKKAPNTREVSPIPAPPDVPIAVEVPSVASYHLDSPSMSSITTIDETDEDEVDQLASKVPSPMPSQPSQAPPNIPKTPTPAPVTLEVPPTTTVRVIQAAPSHTVTPPAKEQQSSTPAPMAVDEPVPPPPPATANSRRSTTRAPEPRKPPACSLIIAARHSSHRAPRQTMAFGIRFPPNEFTEIRSYDLPDFVTRDPLVKTGMERIQKEKGNVDDDLPLVATTGRKKPRVQ